MYLKALEIQGFKSFPEKTVLTFDRDVTAIVGPNGSGKSNISDAIRWVLGEQSSKQLRGTKMEDVIFSGNEERGPSGFAEVTLILDNEGGRFGTEGAEVSVTRRYYRSGEGEYFLNRKSVRLKDITELFMDTGLGRDGYSSISQGRVDEILSVKSTERREIFEEAAGISKYRSRKEEAERRLSRTDDNLLRVGDKIAELELQLTPLKKQSETAQSWLRIHDELRDIEVSLWLQELDKLARRAEKIRADFAAASASLTERKAELERQEAEAEALAETLRAQDEGILSLQDRRQEAERELAQLRSDAAVLRQQLRSCEESAARLTDENTDREARSASLRDQITQTLQRLSNLEQELLADSERSEAAQSQVQKAEARVREEDAALLSHNEESRRTDARASELRAELALYTGTDETLRERRAGLCAELEELRSREQKAQSLVAAAAQAADSARVRSTAEQNRRAGFELKRKNTASHLQEKTEKSEALRAEIRTIRSRLEMLYEMEREHEGYGKAVRELLKERDRGAMPGIRGTVPELIRTEDRFTVAIETALGSSMQSIVVDSQEDAKQGIRMLQNRKIGRATFLPLSVIEARTLNEKNLSARPGCLGIAADLITYDPQYDAVMKNLLGRTVIADTLDHAVEIANAHGRRFRIVTLDGQVLNTGGSMTGGTVSNSSGVLSRANDIRAREAELGTLSKKKRSADEELTAASAEYTESVRLAEAAAEAVIAAAKARTEAEEKQKREELLLQTLRESISAGENELRALDDRLSGEKNKHETLLHALEVVSQTQQKEALSRSDLEARLALAREELTARMETSNAIRLELTARAAEKDSLQSALLRLRELHASLTDDSRRGIDRQNELAVQADDLRSRIRQSEQTETTLVQNVTAVEDAYRRSREERAKTEERRTLTERLRQDTGRAVLELERECARLEQSGLSFDSEERRLTDRLWDNYELTVTAAERIRLPVDAETAKTAASLRKKLSALGTPNLGAIEEFARINERYTFLTDQRDDITASRNELNGIINEITAEMTAIFREEFQKIREAFQTTFHELFGGGKGDLVLEDESNVLECGIDIRVQPPGKSLRTTTLLSGGEKAFVAIALYFSILRVRPAPFCILDEIDAALDDRNVNRFIRYVRSFTQQTQFLLITHRRGTMEGSDILYGVTMTGKGISKMLTLELERVEKELHIKAE